MTIEKLLGLSAKEWEALSDAELEAMLKPYFDVTRPTKEMSVRKISKTVKSFDVQKLMGDVQNLMKQAEIKI